MTIYQGDKRILEEAIIEDSTSSTSRIVTIKGISAYTDLFNKEVLIKASTSDKTVATMNINDLGVKSMKCYIDGAYSDLPSGGIVSGQLYTITYDGNNIVVTSGIVSKAGASSESNMYFIPYAVSNLKDGAESADILTAFGSAEEENKFMEAITNGDKMIAFRSNGEKTTTVIPVIRYSLLSTLSYNIYKVFFITDNALYNMQFSQLVDAETLSYLDVTITDLAKDTDNIKILKSEKQTDVVSTNPKISVANTTVLLNDACFDEASYIYYDKDNHFTTSADWTVTDGKTTINLYIEGATPDHTYINYTMTGTITGDINTITEFTSSQITEFRSSKTIEITYNESVSSKIDYYKMSKTAILSPTDVTGYTADQILKRIITRNEIEYLINNSKAINRDAKDMIYIVPGAEHLYIHTAIIDTMLTINISGIRNNIHISYSIGAEIDESITAPVTTAVLDKICAALTAGEKIMLELDASSIESGGSVTVVDSLDSTSTTDALSANQGKELNEKITKSTTYSMEETVVGTWFGKPLYRKVIDFGALPNATTKEIAHNITNIDKFIKVEGIATRQDATKFTQSLPLVYMSSDSAYNTTLGVNTTSIEIRCTEDRSMFKGYVTLEYTKTTD